MTSDINARPKGLRSWVNQRALSVTILLGLGLGATVLGFVAMELRERIAHHRSAGLDNVGWILWEPRPLGEALEAGQAYGLHSPRGAPPTESGAG